MSSSRIANSSPPRRATVSGGRELASRRRPTSRSMASPASWPRLSLTSLKSSRSRNRTARESGSRPAAVEGMLQAIAEQGAVGQLGQRIVEGAVGELALQVLALGDVAGVDDEALHRRITRQVAGDGLDLAQLAVRALHGALQADAAAGRPGQLGPERLDSPAVLLGNELPAHAPLEGLLTVAEDRPHRGADVPHSRRQAQRPGSRRRSSAPTPGNATRSGAPRPCAIRPWPRDRARRRCSRPAPGSAASRSARSPPTPSRSGTSRTPPLRRRRRRP